MKKVLTICALLAGAFTVMIGTSSCKDKEECCEWTDDFGDDYKFCEEDGIVETSGYDWSYFKAAATSYGGSCD